MESSNRIFDEMLRKLQECLNEFNCKSEIRVSEQDAILFGKFRDDDEKYRIVIHLKEENYVPVTMSANKVEIKREDSERVIMPSLNLEYSRADSSNCSEKEQFDIKAKFEKEANEIGREFLRKAKG